jgi:dihydrofolate reductase
MQPVASIDEAVRIAMERGSDELCVIGGGEIYALTLSRADVLHLTEVDTVVEDAHAFFPAFDTAQWREIARESHPVDAKHALDFDFVEYRRT